MQIGMLIIRSAFPFLFGGTFIEGDAPASPHPDAPHYFPSFSEGLSLRGIAGEGLRPRSLISLPFRRDFH